MNYGGLRAICQMRPAVIAAENQRVTDGHPVNEQRF